MSDFNDIIKQNIEEIERSKATIEELLFDPRYHAREMASVANSLIPQIEQFEGTIEELKQQLVNVISQLPATVSDAWAKVSNDIARMDQDIKRWQEMGEAYLEWVDSQIPEDEDAHEEEEVSGDDELLEAIATGEIQEPSSRTSRKRKPGTKPPLTLRKYRELASKLNSGEDSGT